MKGLLRGDRSADILIGVETGQTVDYRSVTDLAERTQCLECVQTQESEVAQVLVVIGNYNEELLHEHFVRDHARAHLMHAVMNGHELVVAYGDSRARTCQSLRVGGVQIGVLIGCRRVDRDRLSDIDQCIVHDQSGGGENQKNDEQASGYALIAQVELLC